ncbi:HlyD family efflux transporter periplasmic adaptor subunit [Paenibacillus sp. KS-LC4]|uniref:HlyD family efflux transporter periplasmic adaptor subunit n=1 Tax=Paenibacillus sp. KS-LC4 TaxID=2979727 RepID=UPI0030D56E57
MRIKAGFYMGIAIVLIVGGVLLVMKGNDAVSLAESRKQGVLEAGVSLQKNTYYADFYIQEGEIGRLKVNQKVAVHFPNLAREIQMEGVVTSIAAAPQFANLRMTREKGQADLSMFLVRISMEANANLLPGMTAEVRVDEFAD